VGFCLFVSTTTIPRAAVEGVAYGVQLTCVTEIGRRDISHRRRAAYLGVLALLVGTLAPAMVCAFAAAVAMLVGAAGFVLKLRHRLWWVVFGTFVLMVMVSTGREATIAYPIAALLWLGAMAVARRSGRSLRLQGPTIAAVLVALVLLVWPSELVLWRYFYQYVPGGAAIRAVARVGLLTLVPVSVGLAALVEWLETRTGVWLIAVLVLVVALEQGVTTPSYDKIAHRAHIGAIANRIGENADAFYFSPIGSKAKYPQNQLDGMWAELHAGVPTINGYSGIYPPDWMPLAESNIGAEADVDRLRHALAEWVRGRRLKSERVVWIQGVDGTAIAP
jgi:hypothetical protein